MTPEQQHQIAELRALFEATHIETPFTACHEGDCKCHMIWANDHVFAACMDVKNESYTLGEGFSEESAFTNTKYAVAALNALPLIESLQAERDQKDKVIEVLEAELRKYAAENQAKDKEIERLKLDLYNATHRAGRFHDILSTFATPGNWSMWRDHKTNKVTSAKWNQTVDPTEEIKEKIECVVCDYGEAYSDDARKIMIDRPANWKAYKEWSPK